MNKRCSKCGKTKSIDDFHKNKNTKDGRHYYCKECMGKHMKERYIKHREKVLRYVNEYNKGHREEKLKYQKEYKTKNLEKTLKYTKEYYKDRYVKGGYPKGEKNHSWKGGISPLEILIRNLPEYKEWRTSVFKRDNYTCNRCIKRGVYLEAHHHKKSFSLLLQEFLKEYDQFSPIEDKETLVRLAMKYQPFWDCSNGETLCKKCHDLTKLGRGISRNVKNSY